MLRLFAICVFCGTTLSLWAQLEVVPVLKETRAAKTNARTHDLTPLSLPFWDDFARVHNVVDPALWEDGTSVWVNSGMGINPPSYNVVTFDGLNAQGQPYNVNDILAKGFADKLVSAPIRMDEVAPAERTAVAITFFYQFKGNGEAPDAGDALSLHFKNSTGQWIQVWSIENNGTLPPDRFIRITLPILNATHDFFHDTFQFRFQNFARLSGPYDTWHLDYIYINNGKAQTTPVYPLFPDRSITSSPTALFAPYFAIPIRHFFFDPAAAYSPPAFQVTSLRTDQVAPAGQPLSYSTHAQLITYQNEVPASTQLTLENNTGVSAAVPFGEFPAIAIQTLPDAAAMNTAADSIFINLKISIDSGDDIAKPLPQSDYDPVVFNPIRFRSNDTVQVRYALADYYAYDDGKAEYGAGLRKPGAQVAYRFDMLTDAADTLVAVDLYFPRFGDESSQSIQLQVLRNLSASTSDILHIGTIPVQRNSNNVFWRVTLDQPVTVRNFFYIGWRQITDALIAVGLDKNNVVPGKIFTNLNGTWEADNLAGSLMIRPVFGRGNGDVVSGLPEKAAVEIFPNPSPGVFVVKGLTNLLLTDLAGRAMGIQTELFDDHARVTVVNPVSGIYLLKGFCNGKPVVQKILIR
ncbi:MAG: T9SS type A sorting domain-containing protein [Cyclobacteriaceae bacterium]|nr:T9SS type A sorting domain-containing protein [Cyclobacteriaceae bacterium]